MAKVDNTAYRVSGNQLYEDRKKRDLITGCISLDVGLGGGVPMGCTVLVGGKQGGGKSTLTLQYAANAQNKFKAKIFYFNIEGRLDNKILNQIRGIKLDAEFFEVIMGTPILGSDGVIKGNKKMSAEWWWQQISDTIHANPHSVIIIDSIGALTDEKEMSEGFGYQSRGGLQKLEAQFCRKCSDIIVPSGIALFILAHLQANTSGYGEQTQMKCGNAIKHASDAQIFCKSFEKWKPSAEGGVPAGQNMNCRIDKSPLGQPFLETTIPLRYGYGIDDIQDILNHALNWGLIIQAGSWYSIPFIEKDEKITFNTDDKNKERLKFQGEANIREWLVAHPKQCEELNRIIRVKILGE